MSRFNLYIDEQHPSPWQQTWREFKRSHVAMAGVIIIGIHGATGNVGNGVGSYLTNSDAGNF